MYKLLLCCCLLCGLVGASKKQYFIQPPSLECLKRPPPEECFRRGPFLFNAPRVGRREDPLFGPRLIQPPATTTLDTASLYYDGEPANYQTTAQGGRMPWAVLLVPNFRDHGVAAGLQSINYLARHDIAEEAGINGVAGGGGGGGRPGGEMEQ